MTRLVFIHQQSGPQFFRSCFGLLVKFSRKIKCTGAPVFIIVDNRALDITAEGNIHTIPSDNTYREFSGWEAGLKYVRNELHINEMNLILSNDTVLHHRVFDKQWFNGFLNSFKKIFNIADPAFCGDIDRIYCRPPYYSNSVIDKYASTYLLGINYLAMRELKSFIPQEDVFFYMDKVENEVSVLKRVGGLTNSDYWYFLESKLYIKDKSNKYTWYGFDILRLDNYKKLQLKLVSIVIEHNISQKLIERDVRFFDIKDMVYRTYSERLIYRLRRIKFINEFFIKQDYA